MTVVCLALYLENIILFNPHKQPYKVNTFTNQEIKPEREVKLFPRQRDKARTQNQVWF